MTRRCTQFYIFVSAGLILLLLGVLEMTVLPLMIEHRIRMSLPIINSSESATFDKWINPPIPIVTEFYFFNVTNPSQVADEGQKPLLREVGPYVFREVRHKTDLEWSDEQNTVTYGQVRRWYFVPKLSGSNSLDDQIYHINVPLISSADYVNRNRMDEREKVFLYYSINQLHNLTGSTLFHLHSIRELMFDGYADSLIQEAFLLNFNGMSIPYDKFGWFYGRNNTVTDGRYEIQTGKSNLDILGQLVSWNGSVELKHFYGKCNSLAKVSIEFQPPFQHPAPDTIRLFVGDICRPLTLFLDQKVRRKGVTSNRYVVDGRTFDYTIATNRCFCRDSCPRNGAADISSCTYETPALFSLPHFHFADPYYIEQVRGLNPSPGRHAFYMDVHPMLGIPIDVRVAAQISVLMKRDDRTDRLKYVRSGETYLPVLWFVASATATDDMIRDLQILEVLPFYIVLLGIILIAAGLVIIIFMIYWNWEEISMTYINYQNRKRLKERNRRQQKRRRQNDGGSIALRNY